MKGFFNNLLMVMILLLIVTMFTPVSADEQADKLVDKYIWKNAGDRKPWKTVEVDFNNDAINEKISLYICRRAYVNLLILSDQSGKTLFWKVLPERKFYKIDIDQLTGKTILMTVEFTPNNRSNIISYLVRFFRFDNRTGKLIQYNQVDYIYCYRRGDLSSDIDLISKLIFQEAIYRVR